MVGGTGVTVSVDWEDGVISLATCIDGSDYNVYVFNYTYEEVGNYTVSVSASNLANSVDAENQTVSVYAPIRYLYIYGNDSMLAPQDIGTWGLAAGPDQLPLENIFCVWNMGENYGDMTRYVEILNDSTPHEVTFSYGEADAGTQTISVSCSNPVSTQNLTTEVTVIWDNVILGELTCNSSSLWEYPITCQLTIVRFGTGACFEWDMGDGNPLVYYQDGYCASTIAAASPTYVQVDFIFRRPFQ